MTMSAVDQIRRWSQGSQSNGAVQGHQCGARRRLRAGHALRQRSGFWCDGSALRMGSRINAGTLNATEPEALIYEPLSNGAFRLVGVEFIILASVWQTQIPPGSTATPHWKGI